MVSTRPLEFGIRSSDFGNPPDRPPGDCGLEGLGSCRTSEPLYRHSERARGGFAGSGESKNPEAPRSIYLVDTSCADVGSRGHGILRLRLSGCAGKAPLRMTAYECHCEQRTPVPGGNTNDGGTPSSIRSRGVYPPGRPLDGGDKPRLYGANTCLFHYERAEAAARHGVLSPRSAKHEAGSLWAKPEADCSESKDLKTSRRHINDREKPHE